MLGFDWDAPLGDDERDALIEKCAGIVVKRGLTTPAVLFLDMHRPLGFLAAQSLILASGFLAPLFGPVNVRQMARLLESPDNADRLIARIESLSLLPDDTADSSLPGAVLSSSIQSPRDRG